MINNYISRIPFTKQEGMGQGLDIFHCYKHATFIILRSVCITGIYNVLLVFNLKYVYQSINFIKAVHRCIHNDLCATSL